MSYPVFQNRTSEVMLAEILLQASCGILGIFLGAQISEAALLVPYWKAMKAGDFFNLHQTYGKKIHRFFAPLTILATIIPLVTVGYVAAQGVGNLLLAGIMGLAVLAFFSTYFLYFKKANQSFAARSLSDKELPYELIKWEKWHWGRICFEFVAFGCSLLLLAKV